MSVVRAASLCAPVVGLCILSGCNASNSGGLLPPMSGQRVPPPATGSYGSPDPYYQGPAQVANPADDSMRLASADPEPSGTPHSARGAANAPAGESSAIEPAAYATSAPAPRIPLSAMPPADAEREPSTPLRLRMRGMEPIDLSPPPPSVGAVKAPRQQADVGQGGPERSLRTAAASTTEALPWRAPGR